MEPKSIGGLNSCEAILIVDFIVCSVYRDIFGDYNSVACSHILQAKIKLWNVISRLSRVTHYISLNIEGYWPYT